MQKILIIAVVSALLSACADGKFKRKNIDSAVCGGTVSGYTVTYVAYGDAKLVVIPLSKIRDETEWRFILKPLDRKNTAQPHYRDSVVTIEGDSAEDKWISPLPGDVSGSYNSTEADAHTLVTCVKGLPDKSEGAIYKFIVKVEDVGELDPRARVEP